MAAKDIQRQKLKKRKHISTAEDHVKKSASKKRKSTTFKPANFSKKDSETVSLPYKKHDIKSHFKKSAVPRQNQPQTKSELRLRTKELTEARKKKRKRHYSLEQELASLWEKMRRRNIVKEDRSKLVSEALLKMKGKIHEIATSHVSSRILQIERDLVFDELKPHLVTLACNVYAVHLVKKMLDNASKKQLAQFISSLRGHVASLLRHMVGSVVIEHAYHLGDATQKLELVMELYSTEFQLFKDMVPSKESSLSGLIPKLGLQKGSVLRHMTSVIQPILEKGIVDHSIIHKVLVEYLNIADKHSVSEVIQQLSGPDLIRMIHTKDGCKLGILCVKYGNPKERKKIIKGMKDHVSKIAVDQFGSLMLVCILSIVDDTKLVTKIIIRDLIKILIELVFDVSGRRLFLHLLHPSCSRYFSPDDLATLNLSIPCFSKQDDHKTNPGGDSTCGKEASCTQNPDALDVVGGGKKDPTLRRQELLVSSGLAKSLIDICIENAGKFLKSKSGKDILYEVATGGAGGILNSALGDQVNALHEAVASVAAIPRSEEEHVLENFYSSRLIRKLVLNCSAFASTLWKMSLEGKCEIWAKGHSQKVVCAFLESSDPSIRELAKGELQPLLDHGILELKAAR